MTAPTSTGDLQQLPLDQLLLDPNNPRLPASMQEPGVSQEALALYINKHYDPVRIADSVARHEFFQSEPLIAVKSRQHAGMFVVIEGNRRLTALKGLADAELRAKYAKENSAWARLPDYTLPNRFPVLVVENEAVVAPLLGYRHISGIEPWDPYAQARYIARLVNDDGQTLDQIADLVGRKPSEVRSMYRDYDVLEQGERQFGLDTSRARAAFGVFTNAMGRTGVQNFIGAKAPRFVDPDDYPLPDSSKDALASLLRWVFGGPRGDGRVITDSRQLGDLAKVLANERATTVLRQSVSLADAVDALADPDEQFSHAVAVVLRELSKIKAIDFADLDKPAALRRFEQVTELVHETGARLVPEAS